MLCFAVFRRVARDDRHTQLSIISFSVVDARLFGGWGMRGIGAFDFNRSIETELKDKYGEEEGGIHRTAPHRSLWWSCHASRTGNPLSGACL